MSKLKLNKVTLERLKVKYTEAVDGKLDQFKFQGNFLVTNYAKYLIQHAENELSK
jgi:hypothetical protein